MDKLKQLKQAMQNPPPERLAKIEYKSHLYQALGISFVCIVLINKGFWYIIFAFVFGLGISYSQGMTAYNKYKMILEFTAKEKPEDFEKDISLTRRRSKIINHVMGSFPKWVSVVLAVGGAVMFIDPTLSRWLLMLLYPLTILFIYVILYFFIFYLICYYVYKKEMEVGK